MNVRAPIAGVVALAMVSMPFALAAGGDSPSGYASSIALATSGAAAHYRVDLPTAVYAGVRRADLSDLRVVNGAGEFVPYAVIGGREPPRPEPAHFGGPVFPIAGRQGATPDQVQVDVTARSDGSVVSVRTRTGAPMAVRPTPVAWIVDLSKVDSPIAAIRPQWKQPPDTWIGTARVEASDDLKAWRGVATSQLAFLRQGDARVVEDRIEFAPARMRYVRIGFSEGAPELAGIDAEAPRGKADVPRTSLRVAGKPLEKPGEYEFDLGLRAPVDRVRIVVPEINALAPVRLDSRPDARAEWRPVVTTVAWRMLRDGQESASGPVPIAPNPSPAWRAVVDQTAGGFGKASPELEVSWPAATLVFLARGSGPFTLVYGAKDAAGASPASMSIATLVPGYRDGDERAFPVAAAGAPTSGGLPSSAIERAIDTATMGDPKTFGLWAALILGVAVIGAMAWRLSRQMQKGR